MQSKIFGKKFVFGPFILISLALLFYVLFGMEAVSPPENPYGIDDETFAYLVAKQKEKIENPKRYDQPGEAQEFYAAQRSPTGQTAIPVELYGVALQQMEPMPQYSTRLNTFLPSRREMEGQNRYQMQSIGVWEPLGPGNVGGRTRALLIDYTNPLTMYAAGVSGGIWKSTNSGTSWAALDDMMANLAVNSMAMDPVTPTVIYAGTGEGYFNGDQVRGDGIFKTSDGGLTWTQLASTANNANFHYVNDIVVSPNNSQIIYAATGTGVWQSRDAGTNWTQILTPSVYGGCLDLVMRTDKTTDTVFASCGTFVQATVYSGTIGSSITWTPVLSETNMGRTSLAIAPSDQDYIYAMAASIDSTSNYNMGLLAVFRSTDGGATWTARVRNTDGTPLNTFLLSNPIFAAGCVGGTAQFFNQGWYDNVIAVDPTNRDRIWAGGIDLFRSDDGGANWGLASYWFANGDDPQYAHADQHAIVFHPNYDGTTNTQLFVGNDGGIYRTDDATDATATGAGAPCKASNGSVTWTNLNNNYGVTQFYHGLPYPDGTTYFGGTQDNGSIRSTDAAGANAWDEIRGGDGGYVAVVPTNTNTLFVENTELSIQRSTDGGASFSPTTNGITEASNNFLFITPFVMDSGNSQILWTGGQTLWRTTDQANNWNQASASLSGVSTGNVSAIGVAPTDSNYVVAGMSDGFIFRTQSGTTSESGTTWSSVQPANGWISWLTFDPIDKNIVYATYSTFGVDHIWKSSDTGTTWTAIDQRGQPNGIPDIPVHSIVVDPTNTSRLFVGTDLGIFVSTDGGVTWAVENSGFANVVTEALYLNKVKDTYTLFAFTHGRGAYRVALSTGAPEEYTLVVNKVGSGSITRDPDLPTYPVRTVITLEAKPDPGWIFASWSGDLSVTTNPATITMDSNKTITATFVEQPLKCDNPLTPPGATIGFCHQVQPTDTLYSLGRKYGVDPYLISRLNQLYSPNLIYDDQSLFIPAKNEAGTGPNVYLVKPGDTLASVAEQCRLPVSTVAQANELDPAAPLSECQALIIPVRRYPPPFVGYPGPFCPPFRPYPPRCYFCGR